MKLSHQDDPDENRRRQIWPPVILALICVAAFAFMEAIAISEWLAGVWHLADVGNIQYCLVNTWDGRFMHSPMVDGNHFALHFTPIFFLLMPIVWLSSYPIPLVTAYQLALALTPVPIYLLARQRGLPAWIGLAAGIWFIGNHFVGSLQLSNHFEAFYVLFALATMVAMRSPRAWVFWLFALLALSVKEDCALWLLIYAGWEWVFNRQNEMVRSRAVRLAALCVAYGIIAAGAIFVLGQGESTDASRYLDRMGGISIGRDTIIMMLIIVATTGGLCLLNWRASLLLLVCLPIIMGNYHITRYLLYYYSYPVLPFLAFATVAGAATLYHFLRRKGLADKGVTAFIAIALALVGLVQLPMTTRTNDARRWVHHPTGRDKIRRDIAANKLPKDVPVAIQYNLWSVVPWRFGAVNLNEKELRNDLYIFADMSGPVDYSREEYVKIIRDLGEQVDAGRREQIYHAYDFLILSPVTDSSTTSTGSPRP